MKTTREQINQLEKELESPKQKGRCVQYLCSRTQRITELKAGHKIYGTMGYQVMGCYECDGHKINCGAYINGDKK